MAAPLRLTERAAAPGRAAPEGLMLTMKWETKDRFGASWSQFSWGTGLDFFCWFSQIFMTRLWGSSFTSRTWRLTG